MTRAAYISSAHTADRHGRLLMPVTVVMILATLLGGCGELNRPKVEPFYAVTVPPPKQELRWSNGKLPRSLDPARAAAAPETDLVRAAYEGLTDLDSKSLRETPGVAEKWESSADLRTWTFHLRKDARWSNGERVTAREFVRSWKRLRGLGEKAANSYLFQNIIGMSTRDASEEEPRGEPSDFLPQTPADAVPQVEIPELGFDSLPRSQMAPPIVSRPSGEVSPKKETKLAIAFGADAVDDVTLKVSLKLPDKDFAKLVANPIFHPVYGDGSNFDMPRLDTGTITNGAFRITKIDADGITLERSESYWNRKSVELEGVRLVAANSAEAALAAYRKGEVDVVTNAAFAPLALKLLAPYEDFRRTAHNALNFYEFNTSKPPFNDRRVREALAIAIDRAKLAEGDLEGTTQPAYAFFPLGERRDERLLLNIEKARQLLEKAGYANGNGFSTINLVINRNNAQQRIARSVARMWKQNLNIESTIAVKETTEIEAVRKSGDFDILRRGAVLPANDELVNFSSILGSAEKIVEKPDGETTSGDEAETLPEKPPAAPGDADKGGAHFNPGEDAPSNATVTLTEQDAIFELKVIPLYFPVSYSLVKPYVRGFETNGLDAPSLKEVSIDSDWRPKQ